MEPANMRIIPHMKPALYRAAMAGTLEDYRAALPQMRDEGAEDCQLAPNGNTVLHVAVLHGNRHFVDQILQEQMPHASSWRSMLYAQNNKKETVLHCAAEKGDADIVSALIKAIQDYPDLESGVTVREMIQKMDNVMDTALHKAARMGHLRVVELLIEEDNGFRYPTNEAGETPIYLAAESHFLDCLKAMIHNCQNRTYVGPFGRNALHAAILSSGHAPSLWKKLMQIFRRHVDKAGKAGCIKLLLEQEISLCEMSDSLGWTPLHYAVKLGDDETVGMILKKKSSAAYIRAGIDNYDWTTIFHIAARHGNIKMMKCISNSLPDCWTMINCKSQNVLHEAILSNREGRIVKYIFKYPQIDNLINQKDEDGNTPHHMFAISKSSRWTVVDYKYLSTRLKREHLVFNKRHQTPLDVGSQRDFYSAFKHVSGGIPQRSGRRSGPRADLLQIQETSTEVTDNNIDREINGYLRISKTMTLVATLILTISFAAAFTVPGGYDSKKGYPVLLRKATFCIFVLANSTAFMSSVFAIVGYMIMVICTLWDSIKEGSFFMGLCYLNIGATSLALISAVHAFLGGICASLAPYSLLAGSVLLICFSLLFLLMFALYYNWPHRIFVVLFVVFFIGILLPLYSII